MKNYEITEEQIKQLAKGNAKVKEWFPEVFETKLEVGKWYKRIRGNTLSFICEPKENEVKSYGFNNNVFYNDTESDIHWGYMNELEEWTPATDSKVLEALKNEFKKQNPNIVFNYFRFKNNILSGWNLTGIPYELFKDGVFTKFHTQEEAEKLLNTKII